MKRSNYRKNFAIAALALAAAAGAGAKTLVFCSEGSPENFYPGVNTTGTSFDGNEPIYNRIVEFERGGTKVVPGLAEKWDISDDGKVYAFHLGDAKFSDGSPITAEDVAFSWHRMRFQQSNSSRMTGSSTSRQSRCPASDAIVLLRSPSPTPRRTSARQ